MCTRWKLQVTFYLWQKEDYKSGDSISISSEKLPQRGRGGGQYVCDLSGGTVYAIKKHIYVCVHTHTHTHTHIYLQTVSASHME